MEKLFVYADFDWLEKPMLIGELSFDTVRGNETYFFLFHPSWLSEHGNIFFGEDLKSYPGMQFTRPGQDIFGCFSDVLPDRWGRTLLKRREQIVAGEEHRLVRHLTSFDYLMGIDDTSRMGAFRFSKSDSGGFINSDKELRVLPIANVRELMHAANEIEASEENNTLPSMKWIVQLLHPGTSLGGARPKASVIDENGSLTVAKFPSRKDDYDVAAWEHFSHIMARRAGINVSETRIIPGDKYHIFLSRRFDRTPSGQRVHFASALTLIGLNDGDNASTGYGYLDIVDFIIQQGANVENNLEELYRRVAFNIIVGNSDDHFRNHGFLLTRKGWVLSPAYDINPTLSDHQSLLINRDTNLSDLNILLQSASDYMLSDDKASAIINEVKVAMRSWRNFANQIGLAKREIDFFAPRIERFL